MEDGAADHGAETKIKEQVTESKDNGQQGVGSGARKMKTVRSEGELRG